MLTSCMRRFLLLFLTRLQENCRTYHDITRFAHEMSVKEFIELHLRGRRWKRVPTFRLELPVPLGLVIINIGDGIDDETFGQILRPEQVTSAPMKALLDGLCEKGVWRTDPVDLDFRSFMTSFTRTFDSTSLDPATAQNLAVISREYLNLNLRLGYHFNMVDAIMTENRNDNYIYFRFLGGVTDSTRRARRVDLPLLRRRRRGHDRPAPRDLRPGCRHLDEAREGGR